MNNEKRRLDYVVVAQYPQYSRRQLQAWIKEGAVTVDDSVVVKCSHLILPDMQVVLSVEKPKYVSRAGFKLEKALDDFTVDVKDKIILDAGLSTGGFTDCLLQRGASKVYGVDVGHGQVHESISADPRVVVMEHINLKELPALDELVDIVTLDLSFISVLKVMNTVNRVLKSAGELIVLIKPQFEVGRAAVGRKGIVKDIAEHERAVTLVANGIVLAGFTCVAVIESPITGTEGNKEFLAYFKKN